MVNMRLHVAVLLCFIHIKCTPASGINITAVCESENKRCIWKCCPIGQVLKHRTCVVPSYLKGNSVSRLNITVYDEDKNPIDKRLEDVLQLVPSAMTDEVFSENAFNIGIIGNLFLMQEGYLYLEIPNIYDRWTLIKTDQFCVDLRQSRLHGSTTPVILAVMDDETYNVNTTFVQFALVVSIVFLLLTILPYAWFSHLRDMNGIILIIFVTLLVISMIKEISIMSAVFSRLGAIVISSSYYFFTLSSFCWTNVMFYRFISPSEVPETRKKKKFITYILYTVLLPLVMTIFVILTEINEDNSNMPWFITPQICSMGNFNFKGKESVFYLHIPLLLLLAFNMTVVIHLYLHKRRTHDISTTENDNTGLESPLNRPTRYTVLLVILTVYCLLQIIGIYVHPGGDILLNITTMLLGPAVFVTFALNSNVLRILKNNNKNPILAEQKESSQFIHSSTKNNS